MTRATKVAGRYMLVTETVDENSQVVREVMRDDAGNVRAFASAQEAIAAWLDAVRADGRNPVEFARQGSSRFFEVRRGRDRGPLYHVRAAKMKA